MLKEGVEWLMGQILSLKYLLRVIDVNICNYLTVLYRNEIITISSEQLQVRFAFAPFIE
jgi:hypothetical protein